MKKKMENRILVAIDPGKSGGVAVRDIEGGVHTIKMPETPQEILDMLQSISGGHPVFVLMEKVGQHRAGNSAHSSVTFSRHVGHLEMALLASALPHSTIVATSWMNSVAPQRPKGVDSATVRKRKNHIKDLMQRRYPKSKVTLATADALGILTHLIQNSEKY